MLFLFVLILKYGHGQCCLWQQILKECTTVSWEDLQQDICNRISLPAMYLFSHLSLEQYDSRPPTSNNCSVLETDTFFPPYSATNTRNTTFWLLLWHCSQQQSIIVCHTLHILLRLSLTHATWSAQSSTMMLCNVSISPQRWIHQTSVNVECHE